MFKTFYLTNANFENRLMYTVLCKRNESGCRRNSHKLWTFHSDEKVAKSWCIYCSNVDEISQAWWWTETKFRCMRRNFVSSFARIETKFGLVKAKFRLVKRILVFQKFLNTIEYSCNHQLIAKVHVCAILINFLWFMKKKDRNDCYNRCGDRKFKTKRRFL